MKEPRAPCYIRRILTEISKIAVPVLTIARLIKDIFKGGNA